MMASKAILTLPALRRSLSSLFDHLRAGTSRPNEDEKLRHSVPKDYNRNSLSQWQSPDLQYAELFDSWLASDADSYSTGSQISSSSVGGHQQRPKSDRIKHKIYSKQSCNSIGSMTYNEMVAARIGVLSKGLDTYYTLQSTPSKTESRISSSRSVTDFADPSLQRNLRAKQSTSQSANALGLHPPCETGSIEKKGDVNYHNEYLSEETELIHSYAKSIPNVKPFRCKKSVLRFIYQTCFWENYKHLETEIVLFHEDYNFIRHTLFRTCSSISHKVGVVDRFLAKAQNELAEHRFLFEKLQRIRTTCDEIGIKHHESHLLNAQRNLRLAESDFKLLVVQTSKLEKLRHESDHNIFTLNQCFLINKAHQGQYHEILHKCDLFQNKYAVYDVLIKQYYQPLIEHFQKLKTKIVDETFYDETLLPFQKALVKAVQDNYLAHQTMNDTFEYQQELPILLNEVQARLRRKEELVPRKIFVDGILGEADIDSINKLKRRRSRSPERIGAQFF